MIQLFCLGGFSNAIGDGLIIMVSLSFSPVRSQVGSYRPKVLNDYLTKISDEVESPPSSKPVATPARSSKMPEPADACDGERPSIYELATFPAEVEEKDSATIASLPDPRSQVEQPAEPTPAEPTPAEPAALPNSTVEPPPAADLGPGNASSGTPSEEASPGGPNVNPGDTVPVAPENPSQTKPSGDVAVETVNDSEADGPPSGSEDAVSLKSAVVSLPDGTMIDLKDVPDIKDAKATRPVVGVHHLSANAIRCRTRRIFTRKVDGSAKVSEAIFQEWHAAGKPKKNLEEIFKQCGYDTEPPDVVGTWFALSFEDKWQSQKNKEKKPRNTNNCGTCLFGRAHHWPKLVSS